MRRRLDIAASIVVTPELMFLDEPTTGLDPRSRNQVWDIVRALRADRHDDPAVHAVPRRGRPARRRDRGDRPRQGDRRGHARPAEGERRQRRAEGPPARPRAAPAGRDDPRPRARPRAPRTRSRGAAGAVRRRRPRRAGGGRRSPATGSASPRSASASRAWTRSSSPSPATPQRRRSPHEHRRDPRRARLHAAPAAGERALGRPHVRLARDAEGQARPGAVARRDDHAGDVRPDVHLPLRRCDQRLDRRLPGLHPPRHPGHVACCSRPSTPGCR